MSRFVLGAMLAPFAMLGLALTASDANAQIAGTTNKPLPNVLLLVDTSGSMERMPDNSLPSADRVPLSGFVGAVRNACQPGTESNPNRWGMLVQALTGNLQPYFSCDALDRTSAGFKTEFQIGSTPSQPYDFNYFLPYHRPLTGASSALACVNAPYSLPGAAPGAGVGPGKLGSGGDVRNLPPDAFTQVLNQYLKLQYNAGNQLSMPLGTNACTFDQATDGQLDAARDYVRFGLMTFDNDPDPSIGVTIATPPSGSVVSTNPFTGQWSYVKSATNTLLSSTPSPLAMGLPVGCTTGATPFEVGARHSGAPPWEGRMVMFPAADANIYDIETTNDQIQKVLLGSRPYGATPIEGMLEDARDYLWFNPEGPLGATGLDPYVNVGCRDEYIILLTDGAPNLDLRPSCEGTVGPNPGQCPFNKASMIADAMANGTGGRKVTTYVIGFSVNGAGGAANDGFPTAPLYTDCKGWYQGVGATPTAMMTACAAPVPPVGSTAEACCKLNEIAYYGDKSHTTGPFFAESQADLVLSFGRILGTVSKSATTRTLPTYAPTVTVPAVAPGGYTADFIASFIPNARKVWSGEIDRTRSICSGVNPTSQTQSVPAGDSYSQNTADQAGLGQRLFISVAGTLTPAAAPLTGSVIDSARTIRPYATATPIDNIPASLGTEVSGVNQGLDTTPNWAEALDIDDNTCKRSKYVQPNVPPAPPTTLPVPSLLKADCRDITWGFATANAASMVKTNNGISFDFNLRCKSSAGGLGSGVCSNSGYTCSVASPTACTTPGEVCVPSCAALGAIYRSTPATLGLPNQFLRDDAYLQFQASRSGQLPPGSGVRRPMMFVATADGLLHAFKALATTGFDAGQYEQWAFAPPAVLPKLAANFPTGQQILLDGSPVVRDMVWDRQTTTPISPNIFHTTLVAGMGAGGPGYYALNVTDADCGGYPGPGCIGHHTPATTFTQASAANGPHFLWQMTDVPYDGVGDPAKQTRKAKDGTQMVALFGKESGTPALATLQVNPGDAIGPRQIGVAILPGGMDGPPIKGVPCPRAMDGGAATGYTASNFDFSDPAFPRRTAVRAWGAPCNSAPVPGRSVTIVRADTGEVIRHFGRLAQDVPRKLSARTTDTPFDSPIIGTPAVYPNIVGATAQKIFVGDADGTLWKIDVSSPLPANWTVSLFQDVVSRSFPGTPGALQSEPINIPPVLSLDPSGAIIINAATGDQENLVANASETNYIVSLQEQRPTTPGQPGPTSLKWYKPLTGGERVTGPMTIFDRTLYFATYTPQVPNAATCGNDGNPFLYGMDFFVANPLGINQGGAPRWCQIGSVDPISGACLVALTAGQSPLAAYPTLAGAIIPGVTVRAQQSCVTDDGTTNDPNITGLTQTKFDLFFGATAGRSSGGTGTPQAERPSSTNLLTRPLPRTTAVIDAWALVVD